MIATITADTLLEVLVGEFFDELGKHSTAIVHPGILASAEMRFDFKSFPLAV